MPHDTPDSVHGASARGDFPRDAFDDVPEDGARQGVHRSADAAPLRTSRELVAIVVVGVLGLLIGALAYVLATIGVLGGGQDQAPSGAAPSAAASETSAASETTAASEEATAEPSTQAPTVAPQDAEAVGVFNASAQDGAAAAAAAQLTEGGWTVAATGNWDSVLEQSAVFHTQDGEAEAQAEILAEALGIETVQVDETAAYPLVVVIGQDSIEQGASS